MEKEALIPSRMLTEKAYKRAYMKGYFAGRLYVDKHTENKTPKKPFRTPSWVDATLMIVITLLLGSGAMLATISNLMK